MKQVYNPYLPLTEFVPLNRKFFSIIFTSSGKMLSVCPDYSIMAAGEW